MYLHGDLGNADFGSDLLVHEAARDQGHHLPFPGGQGRETSMQAREHPGLIAADPVAFDCRGDGIQHVLVAEWLGQEVDGSGLHRPDRHRDIPVTRHENDRNANIGLRQLGLKVEAAQPGQPDVEDQAAGNVRKLALQKLVRRTEHFDPQPHRPEKVAQRFTHRRVVVDNKDDRFLGACEGGRRCWTAVHVLSS